MDAWISCRWGAVPPVGATVTCVWEENHCFYISKQNHSQFQVPLHCMHLFGMRSVLCAKVIVEPWDGCVSAWRGAIAAAWHIFCQSSAASDQGCSSRALSQSDICGLSILLWVWLQLQGIMTATILIIHPILAKPATYQWVSNLSYNWKEICKTHGLCLIFQFLFGLP
jgi:hypothetical protein